MGVGKIQRFQLDLWLKIWFSILFQRSSIWTFWFTFEVIFAISRRKGPRPKWTIHKHESDKIKKCLSVGNFGILSVVICSASTAYINLCKGLANLLKILYFIQDYPSVTRFLNLESLCLGRSKILCCQKHVWKN